MKTNELRIGNYLNQVKYLNGLCNEIRKVTSINKEGFLNVDILSKHIISSQPIDWFIPIALTEAWIYKFDFINIGGIFTKDKTWFEIENTKNKLWFSTYGNDVEIKYVHQLQNLYHSLTGEELQLKD